MAIQSISPTGIQRTRANCKSQEVRTYLVDSIRRMNGNARANKSVVIGDVILMGIFRKMAIAAVPQREIRLGAQPSDA